MACRHWVGLAFCKCFCSDIHLTICVSLSFHCCRYNSPVTDFSCHLEVSKDLLSLAKTASGCVVDNRLQAEPQLTHIFCYAFHCAG